MSPENRKSGLKDIDKNNRNVANSAERNSEIHNGAAPTINYVSGDSAGSSSSHQFHKNSTDKE